MSLSLALRPKVSGWYNLLGLGRRDDEGAGRGGAGDVVVVPHALPEQRW